MTDPYTRLSERHRDALHAVYCVADILLERHQAGDTLGVTLEMLAEEVAKVRAIERERDNLLEVRP